MSRLGTWRHTRFQKIYPKLPKARGFGNGSLKPIYGRPGKFLLLDGLGSSEEKHFDSARKEIAQARIALDEARLAIIGKNCEGALFQLSMSERLVGRARAHYESTDGFFKAKIAKRLRETENITTAARRAIKFYCVLDTPILTANDTFAGLRRRRRR